MAKTEYHIVRAYGSLLDSLHAGLSRVAPEDRIDLAYADLIADPAGAISRIYGHFGLTGFESAWPAMQLLLKQDRPAGSSTDEADWDFARRQVDRVSV